MSYTKKQFIEDVKKEARALREKLTVKEKQTLSVELLDPQRVDMCLYGQISGHCRNRRSVELITACCKRFMKNDLLDEVKHEASYIRALNAVKRNVNGRKSHKPSSLSFISSIESYIILPNARNANLIAYLKGEINDLVL
jgi:hypothetical protein